MSASCVSGRPSLPDYSWPAAASDHRLREGLAVSAIGGSLFAMPLSFSALAGCLYCAAMLHGGAGPCIDVSATIAAYHQTLAGLPGMHVAIVQPPFSFESAAQPFFIVPCTSLTVFTALLLFVLRPVPCRGLRPVDSITLCV